MTLMQALRRRRRLLALDLALDQLSHDLFMPGLEVPLLRDDLRAFARERTVRGLELLDGARAHVTKECEVNQNHRVPVVLAAREGAT